jgi:hypothetical protein
MYCIHIFTEGGTKNCTYCLLRRFLQSHQGFAKTSSLLSGMPRLASPHSYMVPSGLIVVLIQNENIGTKYEFFIKQVEVYNVTLYSFLIIRWMKLFKLCVGDRPNVTETINSVGEKSGGCLQVKMSIGCSVSDCSVTAPIRSG